MAGSASLGPRLIWRRIPLGEREEENGAKRGRYKQKSGRRRREKLFRS